MRTVLILLQPNACCQEICHQLTSFSVLAGGQHVILLCLPFLSDRNKKDKFIPQQKHEKSFLTQKMQKKKLFETKNG